MQRPTLLVLVEVPFAALCTQLTAILFCSSLHKVALSWTNPSSTADLTNFMNHLSIFKPNFDHFMQLLGFFVMVMVYQPKLGCGR